MYEIIAKLSFKWDQYLIVAQASAAKMSENEIFVTLADIRKAYPHSIISVVQN